MAIKREVVENVLAFFPSSAFSKEGSEPDSIFGEYEDIEPEHSWVSYVTRDSKSGRFFERKHEPTGRYRLLFDKTLLTRYGGASTYQTSPFEQRLSTVEERLSLLKVFDQRITALESKRPVESHVAILNTLGEGRSLRLAKPVGISFEEADDGSIVARWAEALLEGEGGSQLVALDALREAIVDAHADLSAAQAEGVKLAGYPAALWGLLNEFVTADAAAPRER